MFNNMFSQFHVTFHAEEDHSMASNRTRLEMKHYRRYSWPPSLHLINVSENPIALPSIHDNPFAHFLEKASNDNSEGLDQLLFTAGILPAEAQSMLSDKAKDFCSCIYQRWKALCSRNFRRRDRRIRKQNAKQAAINSNLALVSSSELRFESNPKSTSSHTMLFKTASVPSSASPAYSPMSANQILTPVQAFQPDFTTTEQAQAQTELTSKQVQMIYRAANGYQNTRPNSSQRRSWNQPAVWLYPIKEQLDEDGVDDNKKGGDEDEDSGS